VQQRAARAILERPFAVRIVATVVDFSATAQLRSFGDGHNLKYASEQDRGRSASAVLRCGGDLLIVSGFPGPWKPSACFARSTNFRRPWLQQAVSKIGAGFP
jgi:hypothetical protein